jgi:hypothetical protein
MPPFFVVFLVVFLADFFFAMASIPPFIDHCMYCKNSRQRFFNSGTENLSPRAARVRALPRARAVKKCHYAEGAEGAEGAESAEIAEKTSTRIGFVFLLGVLCALCDLCVSSSSL